MKNLVLIIFLFSLHAVFAQQKDSFPETNFQPIFGCVCCEDTIVQLVGEKNQYECILNKQELLLTGSKNGKIIWTIDLKEILEHKNVSYLCLRRGFGGKYYNNLLVYNEKEIVMYISAKNGKEINIEKGKAVLNSRSKK